MNEPFDVPVLGIDLGASFTKVSYRRAWQHGNRYELESEIVMLEGNALVPSLVIKTGNERKPWLFGQTAARYRPKQNDRVFVNWKSDLFSEKLTPEVTGSLKAAGEFFGWLRQKLIETEEIDVDACRVKVCIPAFPNVKRAASILGQEMELAGWKNIIVSKVEEPRANTVGVFSEGRNTLFRTRDRNNEINPVLMDIYPQSSPILAHLRSSALSGGPRKKTIGVIDVGSFTTDFSVVEIDAGADADNITAADQFSHRIGIINDFEKPLLASLGRKYGFMPDELSFEDREDIKRALANGKRHALAVRGDEVARIGDDSDQQTAADFAQSLANSIDQVLEDVALRLGRTRLVLTGGGSAAPLVRDAIENRLKKAGYTFANVEGIEVATGLEGVCRLWPDTGETLSRLATALGASSVLLDLPFSAVRHITIERREVESHWIVCSCHGGNKDCMRCGGAGQYRRA